MRTIIAVLALTFFVTAVASAASAKSVPGHHAKGIHGASYYAPGHVKKRKGMQSARGVAPGRSKY